MGFVRFAPDRRRQIDRQSRERRTLRSWHSMRRRVRPSGKSPGAASAYGSFISGRFGGRFRWSATMPILSAVGMCGREARLWRLPHRSSKEFGVPTPVAVRRSNFSSRRNPKGPGCTDLRRGDDRPARPSRSTRISAPDSHTPIVVGNRVFGVWSELFCLDLSKGLKADLAERRQRVCRLRKPDRLSGSGTRRRAQRRVAAVGHPQRPAATFSAACKSSSNDHGVYSHPALVGTRLFLRGSSEIVCINRSKGDCRNNARRREVRHQPRSVSGREGRLRFGAAHCRVTCWVSASAARATRPSLAQPKPARRNDSS